jgi:hypothetical protein
MAGGQARTVQHGKIPRQPQVRIRGDRSFAELDLIESPCDTAVNECVTACCALGSPDEFVRRRGQAEMEKAIVCGGDRPPKINLAWRTRGRRNNQFIGLVK